MRPRHQVGTCGRSNVLSPASSSRPSATSSDAGPASSATSSASQASHCSCGRRGPLLRPDLRARHVGEPHDVAGRQRVGAEERAPPEHEVPGLRCELVAEPGTAGDAAEVGQPDVAGVGGGRVDGPSHPRAHPVGGDEQVPLDDRPVGQHGPHPVGVVVHGHDLGTEPHVRTLAARGIREQDGERRPLEGEGDGAVPRSPRSPRRGRPRRDAPAPSRRARVGWRRARRPGRPRLHRRRVVSCPVLLYEVRIFR